MARVGRASSYGLPRARLTAPPHHNNGHTGTALTRSGNVQVQSWASIDSSICLVLTIQVLLRRILLENLLCVRHANNGYLRYQITEWSVRDTGYTEQYRIRIRLWSDMTSAWYMFSAKPAALQSCSVSIGIDHIPLKNQVGARVVRGTEIQGVVVTLCGPSGPSPRRLDVVREASWGISSTVNRAIPGWFEPRLR